jgi:3-oxoacyl-[acyl-carrier protein] reductase
MSSLDTKVAFVTGGARGIGAAIVERLAQEGAIVRFTYVSNTTAADGLVTRLNAAGGQVDAVRVDAADIEATQSAIHALVSAKGGLDIVVASAGAFLLGPIDTFAQEDFDRVMNINVRGDRPYRLVDVGHCGPPRRVVSRGSPQRSRLYRNALSG